MQAEGSSSMMQRMQTKLMEFVDPSQSQDVRLKAGHDIIDHIESIGNDRDYEKFLQELIDHINKILSSVQPAFLQEMPQHQIRKYCFEILHKVPNGAEVLRPYIRPILIVLMKAVECENEENTLICLKTIVEYQKLYRPQYSPEVSAFIRFVREVYRELQNQTAKIFEPKGAFTVADLAELNLDTAILDIFTTTPIQVKKDDGGCSQCNLLPKSCYSLKVLQEIPILVVLMYQMYKQQIHAEISDLIPLICAFINLQPSEELRLRPDFNREVYVDFVAAQIKTLSFLAYIIRIYQEQISTLHRELVSGVLSLLKNCPKEVAHMRKELFIAVRHIFSTDIRKKFVSVMDQLCDESILIGDGYTMREALRPLAYSTIADVVHHIRGDLSMRLMALAVNLFGRNVDDETLPHTIQLMSLKLLLHLVECIRIRCDQESNPHGRLLILKIMNICINKCKAVAKYHLPALIAKCKREEDDKPVVPAKVEADVKEEKKDFKESESSAASSANKDDKGKKHLVYLQWNPYSLPECRNVVKTLICGLKSGSFAFVQCKSSENSSPKQLTSKDVRVYIRLFKYAIMCMDVYMISQKDGDLYLRPAVVTSVKMKEEKDNLEHLAGIFPMISQTSFREILEDTIDLFIDRMKKNLAVQFMANSFLANVMTSSTFATILLDRLLLNMKEIGEDSDDANMYLKLYKLAFGSVSLLPTENEVMLQPYLSRIVMQSVEYCLTANEPNNYLLLLRALFRSIGGGSHERLYREFLPLLPTFLRSLNKLLSAPAKKNMRDLFVDLCLIVPVRLSSLLPHLGLLMEPLVAALNGSQVFQGLRTLELCVDNLQDEFLAQQAPSLRFEMLQGLWKAIRDPNESNSTLALRLLGKLGGTNRQSLYMPQKLEVVHCRAQDGPTALIQLAGDEANMTGIKLPLARLVKTAHDCLLGIRAVEEKEADHYKRLAWKMLQAYVAGLLEDGNPRQLEALMCHSAFRDHALGSGNSASSSGASFSSPLSTRLELERSVAVDALTGVFLSLAEPNLRKEASSFVVTTVRQLSLVCLSQQAGPAAVTLHEQEVSGQRRMSTDHLPTALSPQSKEGVAHSYLDPHILIDALCRATSSLADKEAIVRIASCVDIILETVLSVLGSFERLAQLEMINYLAEKIKELLYEETWCHKWSACVFLERLLPIMPVSWVRQHALNFVRGLLYEVVHLDGLISQGCFPKAESVLEMLVRRVMSSTAIVSPAPPSGLSLGHSDHEGMETEEEEEEALHESKSGVGYQLTAEFTASLVSENSRVAEECRRMLRLLSELRGNKPLRDLLKPHRGALEDLLPPKNFLIRQRIVSQQRAIMDMNYFFASQNPSLVRYDPEQEHHKRFLEELRTILTASKEDLRRLPCYATEDNLISLRRAACRVLSTCHYLGGEDQANIFGALFTAMRAEEEELSREGFEGLKVYADHCRVEIDILHRNVKPMLSQIRTWELIQVRDLRNLKDCAQIFPTTFSERLCESLQNHFRPLSEELMKKYVNSPAEIVKQRMPKYLELCSHLIDVFHIVPSASAKYVESMSRLIFNVERSLNMDATSALRLPLLRFLLRYPRYTLTQFLTTNSWLHDQHVQRFTIFCVRHPLGEPFRKYLRDNSNILLDLLRLNSSPSQPSLAQDANFMAVKLIRLLSKNNVSWFVRTPDLVTALIKYWESPELIRKHQSLDQMDFMHWNEQQLILKCFILFFDHNRDSWDVLISMLRVLQTCSVGTLQSFQFVKDYLLQLARTSSVDWKRRLFHLFVDSYCRVDSPRFADKATRARIILYLLIPCFHFAFENGDKEQLMGGPPNPEQETLSGVPLEPDLANVFVNQVLNPDMKEELDCVRISQLHLACLLVDYASEYIHAGGTKRQGNLLRRLMTYAWPCLQQGVQCVDPLVKYHGHLLLVHIINRFAIHKKIVVQVFHSLLKASAAEGRKAVNPALDILVPIMNIRMEDENQMLLHWTKKIFTEDSQAQQQCSHLMNLVVRQADVFFPVRHSLIPNLLSAMTRWCMQVTTHYENKKLLNDLFDTIIKWEKRQLAAVNTTTEEGDSTQLNVTGLIDRSHREQLLGLVIRFIIQTVDGSLAANPTAASSNSDHLARQAFHLLENALKTKVWPDLELRLSSFDRYLSMPENPNSNQTALLTTLEVLRLLLQHMDGPSIQTNMRFIAKGLIGCVKSTANQRCVRACAPIVTRIFTLFPPEPPNNQRISMIGELSEFYQAVFKAITDAFTQYERCSSATSNPATSHLYSAICLLKATQVENNYSFLDRVLTQFCRVLYKMKSDVVSGGTSDAANTYIVDMLISALEMVKGRFNVMSVDMRKNLIQQVILSLIDKSSENKLIRAIIGLTKEWVSMTRPEEVNLVPYPREKSQLFSKLYLNLHRWEDPDIRKEFLETVYLVYVNDAYKTTDLIAKLESHFCMGLCSHVPDLRQRFTDLFIGQSTLKSSGSSMRSRILFLVSCVRWDQACFNEYYWIPICNQILLHGAAAGHGVEFTGDCALIPAADRVVQFAEPVEQKALHQAATVKTEPMEADDPLELPAVSRFLSSSVTSGELTPQPVAELIRLHTSKMAKIKAEVTSENLVAALRQFCYISPEMAHDLFLDLLPAAWSMMDTEGQRFCAVQARRFIASGIHTGQSDIQPTPLSSFTQALMKCEGFPATVPFPVFHYIAANFNAWHPVALLFEQFYATPPIRAMDASLPAGLGGPSLGGNTGGPGGGRSGSGSSGADVDPAADLFPQDWQEGLIMLYDQMKEDDYMAALWARRTSLKDLSAGLVFAQQGQFDQAKEAGERLMSVKPSSQKEIRAKDIYMEHYLGYLKQLNYWEVLTKMGSGINALDLAEAYFMKQNYLEMTKALSSADGELSRSDSWRLSLLRGFNALTNPANKRGATSSDAEYPLGGGPTPAASASVVDRHIRYASTHLIKEWKHLPVLVSSLHLPLLRAAQQITEVQEAASVVTGNASVAAGAAPGQSGVRTGAEKNVFQDLRNLTKAWRHRMPLTSDNTAFWFIIFNWRFQVLQMVTQNLVPQAFSEPKIRNHVISVFTSEMHTAWLNMARAARKHNLQLVSLELLERMYSMGDTSLAYERFKQELKCRMEVSGNKREEYIEMMDFMEKVNITNFTREEKAEFFSFKGVLLARVHKGDEANRNFSYSVQLNDDGYRLWTHYGDFVESIFKDHSPSQKRDTMIKSGRHAAYCFTEAVKICRTEESKARRHIAKCFWLLCWDDAQGALARVLDERSSQIPPEFLLPWVPTLVACLLRSDGSKLMNILLNLVKEFPLAVYLPVKCLFQQLNREGGSKRARGTADEGSASGQTAAENRTSAALWRCSNILQKTRELHPSLVNLQDQLCEQLVWIGGLSWAEEALVQLQACLRHTLQAAHEANSLEGKLDRQVPAQLAARLHKVLADFGGVAPNTESSDPLCERRRLEAEADASYRSLKKSFISDFEQVSVSNLRTILNKISTKWTRLLTCKVKMLPRRILLDSEKTRLLLEYSSCSAAALGELPLPGEVTSHLPTKHHARIGSICPWVERVIQNGQPQRRLMLVTTTGRRMRYLLQSLNGPIGGLYESWREVRITQLFRTVNTLLLKNRETSRRFLQLHIPRVMDVSAGARLVEEGELTLSLWQIYENSVPDREIYKPLHVYYERLSEMKTGDSVSLSALRDVYLLVQSGVDKGILRRWAYERLPDASHFWHFRKAFTQHLALLFMAEYALFLTSMSPEALMVEINTGRCHVNFFKFCVSDKTGEVEGARPVPSRMTPNILELLTTWGVNGPLVASMIAAARCLDNPRHQFVAYLRASLRDEYIVSHRLRNLRGTTSTGQTTEVDLDSGTIVHLVVKAVQMISARLHNLSLIDGCGESKASNVVQSAFAVDNLALMDPSWHPWL